MYESSSRPGAAATPDALAPRNIVTLRVLGHGRAAEARLVQVHCGAGVRADADIGDAADDFATPASPAAEGSFLCVEKLFHPGLLTRVIYRICFQAPFPYQSNRDAILASFYRRRVAASIVRALIPEAAVAQPLYVRWDRPTQAWVLASEYIRGRGLVPAPADPQMIRRGVRSLIGRREPTAPPPPAEIDQLLDLMTRLERLLVDCGLTGSGWQVCKRAMVSTANLLRTEAGYVVVDLESGIPSVLVPSYVVAGLRLGGLPLFDDLDAGKLRIWVRENRAQLAEMLTLAQLHQLDDDIARLIRHSENWKLSELAIGRRPQRLMGGDFRHRFKTELLDSWQRRQIIDEPADGSPAISSRFFLTITFLLGLIPGPLGGALQRFWASRSYRQQLKRLARDPRYRQEVTQAFTERKAAQWHSCGRTALGTNYASAGGAFCANWVLSKFTPPLLHRLIADPVYRKQRLVRMFLFCVSGRFQSELGRMLIQTRVLHWRNSGRLSGAEADQLLRQLDSPAIDEYVRCFGLHIGLKLLLPVMMSLKIGGAAASVASGNPFYLLFMLMLLPMLRTGVTLWRIAASGRPLGDYRDALLVGIVPVAGSLAYPLQMYAKFSGLSLFLLRDFAGRVGCWLPIYGGKDSRTELAAIKSVNVVAELLELWLAATASPRSADAGATRAQGTDEQPASIAIRRWDSLARAQLRLMQQEAELLQANGVCASEQVTAKSKGRHVVHRAA